MTWFLYCIARHPEYQVTDSLDIFHVIHSLDSFRFSRAKQLVMDEVDQVFGEDMERPCTTQDAAELKYLECCIKETLRLYPSVPAVMRCLTEDVDIGTII